MLEGQVGMQDLATSEAVRWQVSISRDTDEEAREYLRAHALEESNLSALVEDAVHMYIFQQAIDDSQRRNVSTNAEELQAMIDDTVRSVRREMYLEQAGCESSQTQTLLSPPC